MEICHKKKKNLVLYAYGELDANSGKEIETHLARCKLCRSEYQQLLSLLGNIKETVSSPELSAKQVNSLVTNINWELKDRKKAKWWRWYLNFRPAQMIPAIATACILIIAAGVIGYLKTNDTNGFRPISGQPSEELILSDTDLEIIRNLEFLKEMEAIQKLSQVVDLTDEINSQGELDNETRGMRQNAYGKFVV